MDAEQGVIVKLPPDVVNKIAAGEVVQRPCHAVKELIENALDAGATAVTVVAPRATAFSVRDNGHGVRFSDMKRLCERFTTSKLKTYDDLLSIGTFGFRGEALASMSYVAKVKVSTRRQGALHGHCACYQDGVMQAPLPALMRSDERSTGTTVEVDDLYYNLPTRRNTLCAPGTEYHHIAECVRKYAMRYPHCAFACRKNDAAPAEVSTPVGSTRDVIAALYGPQVVAHLFDFTVPSAPGGSKDGEQATKADGNEKPAPGAFKVRGWATGVDYYARQRCATYFVNGRLVENVAVHKATMQAYAPFLGGKGRHPFVCVFVEVDPKEVDVNVHPTKAEVALLQEEAIADAVCAAIMAELAAAKKDSKAFPVVKPSATAPRGVSVAQSDRSTVVGQPRGMIVDSEVMQNQNIDLQIRQNAALAPHSAGICEPAAKRVKVSDEEVEKIKAQADDGLKNVFANAKLVGIVGGDRSAVVQSGGDLYLLDLPLVLKECARQDLLVRRGNKGCGAPQVTFVNPPRVSDLAMVALGLPGVWDPKVDGSKEELVQVLSSCLVKHRLVLAGMQVDITPDGRLAALPRVWDAFVPALGLIPIVLLRIGCNTNWQTADLAAAGLAQELSALFAYLPDSTQPLFHAAGAPMRTFVPDVLLPHLRSSRFRPPAALANDKALVKIATTASLLATFDRNHCVPW